MATQSLRINSDNLLTVNGLYDTVAAAYVNDANVTVTLEDRAGNEVSGASWPLTLDYVAASSGVYRCILPDVLVLKNFGKYIAVIVADGGADKKRTWYMPVIVFRDG